MAAQYAKGKHVRSHYCGDGSAHFGVALFMAEEGIADIFPQPALSGARQVQLCVSL